MTNLNQNKNIEYGQLPQSLPGWDSTFDVDVPNLDMEISEVREIVSYELWSNIYPSRRERLFAQSR